MNDEEDVEALFNVHDSNQLHSGIELYSTFATNESYALQLSPYQNTKSSGPTYDIPFVHDI